MGNQPSGGTNLEEEELTKIYTSPVKKRKCTDVICCLLFVAYMVGMVVIALIGIRQGSPKRLLSPTDSNGKVCGSDITGKPYLYFFDISKCITKGASDPLTFVKKAFTCPTPQVCVSKCNTVNAQGHRLPAGDMICIEGTELPDGVSENDKQKLVDKGKCAPYYLKSKAIFYRCVPTLIDVTIDSLGIRNKDGDRLNRTDISMGEKAVEFLLSIDKALIKVGEELKLTWKWILFGFIISMGISLVYIVLARWITFPLVVTSAIGTLTLIGYATYYSFAKYKFLKSTGTSKDLIWRLTMTTDDFKQSKESWLVLGIVLAVMLLILLLICAFLFSNVRLACGLIAEASRAVCSMLSTLIFPIIPWIFQAAWFCWFIIIMLYLMSNGMKQYQVSQNDTTSNLTAGDICDYKSFNYTYPDTEAMCMFTKYVQNMHLFPMQIFHVFGWLWGANFIIAFTEFSLAGAFASYYWSFNKPTDIPSFPVIASMIRALVYHSGSLALGAAIIGTVQLIRITLEYIRRKLKEHTDNKVTDFILKCLGCCFWCLEKCLRFVNKNAYIMMAITGKNFCTSAKKAVVILISSIGNTISINGITSFILFLGKVLITGGIGVGSFYWFSRYNAHLPEKLDYSIVPIVICTVGAYLVTRLFFSVYDMGIDTIFLCYLHDVNINDGSREKPYFMSESLQDIMDKHNKKENEKQEEFLLEPSE